MTTLGGSSAPRRALSLRGRWPMVLLAASLVLNGFLVGMLLMDWMRPHGWHSGPRMYGFELRRMADRLSPEAVERLQADLAPRAPALEARFARLRAMRDDVGRLVAVPTPDRAAVDAKLAELRAEAAAMQEQVQRDTYDALLKLPPEMRAPLAEPSRRP